LQVEKDHAEQEERAEERGEKSCVPLGGDGDSGDNQKNANEVGTDGPARCPRRNGWKATEVVSVEEVLRAEGGDADCEEQAAEVAEEEHWIF